MSRAHRKNEHIYHSLKKRMSRADFKDISFIHNCLPNMAFNQVSLKTEYMGRTYRSPLFINAITGGSQMAYRINSALADVARVCNMPMAVGSQMAAFEDSSCTDSFTIARKNNPGGEVWANLGTYASPEMASKAVKMLNADALQIHINVPQELVMKGGDRDFRDMSNRIKKVVNNIEVPVIAKEVGFGVAREQAEALLKAGVSAIDVGGRGGTNFIAIEGSRSGRYIPESLLEWGIPTAISLIETVETIKGRIDIFASGGMNNALDIARALSLGAKAVGLAAMPLNTLVKYGRRALIKKIYDLENELKLIMMMTGSSSIAGLQKAPLVITGFTYEWLERRGINSDNYARRSLV